MKDTLVEEKKIQPGKPLPHRYTWQEAQRWNLRMWAREQAWGGQGCGDNDREVWRVRGVA